MYFTHSKEKNNHPNIYLHISCLQAVLVVSLMTIDTQQLTTTTTHELFKPLIAPSLGDRLEPLFQLHQQSKLL